MLLPPQVACRRLKLGVYLCAVFMATSMLGLAQSQSSSSDTTNSNGATPTINNPQNHNVSTGNYIPPPPPSGPDVYTTIAFQLYGAATYTNFLAGPQLLQRSNMGGWKTRHLLAGMALGHAGRCAPIHWEPPACFPIAMAQGNRRTAHRSRPPATTIEPSPAPALCSTTLWRDRSIG